MIILGIDTVSRHGGVAIRRGNELWTRDLADPRRHAETLIPSVLELLEESSLTWADLDLVAVDAGPGSFTGTRVGVAAALGLAASTGTGVTGVGCLDILATACYDASLPPVGGYMVSAADVRRGEVVWAGHRISPDGPVRDSEDRLHPVGGNPPDALVEGAWLTGDGAQELWPGREDLRRFEPDGRARAAAAARLGEAALVAGVLEEPIPRYARPADALPRRRNA